MAFEVRDSICEAIIERLRDELACNGDGDLALELVTGWLDYWSSMPPGCKDLALECPAPETREALIDAMKSLISKLNAEGEQLRVAKQIGEILAEK